ncbi:MAG TPA: efflux RND transporter periplasmic adaptor subunit [Vicinamibacterales bacterium]|nr:efflux RND transporter periplasmic adaptor subunit [Vicinamibacterales bacterium]
MPGLVIAVVAGAAATLPSAHDPQSAASGSRREGTFTVARRDFVRSIRLSGTVEAVESTTVAAPRISGPSSSSLVITKLVKAGTTVRPGDLLVEFDRQAQLTTALDRQAELNDLEQQIRKRQAEENAARARDDSELKQADSAVSRADLEMAKNEMLPKIQAEKNQQALEQAQARRQQLIATFDLKRKAAQADMRILEIRRDKAANAMKMAEANASRMEVRSPIAGLAVIRSMWKSNGQAEILEGEEVRAGVPVVDIVNPSKMRVRVRVNQADINDLRTGQRVRVGLDAYPDLTFGGRIAQISPLAVTSTLSPKVRYFVMLAEVDGAHEKLMPDLTASLDVELSRTPGAIVVPRDAIRQTGTRTIARVRQGSSFEDRDITIGAVSAHEALVTGGLQEGVVLERNLARASGK